MKTRQYAKARAAQRHAAQLGNGSFGSTKPKPIRAHGVPKVSAIKPFSPFHKG